MDAIDEEYHMKIVTPKDGDLDPTVLEASNLLKENDITPEWIDYDQCLNVDTPQKNHCYVIHPFEGPAFEHLKLVGCRVLGPQCILASLNFSVELPKRKHPIYNVCMKDVTICCTNMNSKTRDKMHRLVELMAGEVSRPLTEEVTHLIAEGVGSEKYTVAATLNTPVMSVKWVEDIWEIAQNRYVDAKSEDMVQKYRCPVFKGLVITVSGLSHEERKNVKLFVESEGGVYTGEMKSNHCTHLIAKEPKGMKYDYAVRWRIHIVTLRWMYESLDKNYCQNEKNYPLPGLSGSAGLKTSTPERSRLSAVKPNIVDISAISTNGIEETVLTGTRLSDTTMDHAETMNMTTFSAGNILDACNVYLSEGVQGSVLEGCKRAINSMGASRLTEIAENVTHVVMEQKVDRETDILHSMNLRPHVVHASWLAECYRLNRHVDERPHLNTHFTMSELELPKIPPPKRGTKEKRNKERNFQKKGTLLSSTVVEENRDEEEGVMGQMLSQYVEEGGETTVQPADEVDGATSTLRESSDSKDVADATQEPVSESAAADAGIFGKKTFVFFGFSEEDELELSEYLTQAGGVYLKGTRKVADYGIVPVLGCQLDRRVRQVVTNIWMQMCCEAGCLLPVDSNPLFSPVDMVQSAKPLEGCVLSISGYVGVERDCLAHIADLMGAVFQEFFVRVSARGLLPNTHLIVKEADGSKYNAAKKWNVPALSKDWLFACAKTGKREDEELFSIDSVNSSKDNELSTTPAQTNTKPDGVRNKGKEQTGTDLENRRKQHASVENRNKQNRFTDHESIQQTGIGNVEEQTHTGHTMQPTHRETTLAELAPPSSSSESVRSAGADSVERVPSSSDREQGVARSSSDLNNPMAPAKAMVQHRQSGNPQSQKENMTTEVNRLSGKPTTPAVVKRKVHGRVEELQQQSRKPALSPGVEFDSPSVFLAPGYRPKFDLTGIMEYLKSPEAPQRRESMSLQDFFEHHLALAVKKSAVPRNTDARTGSTQNSQEEERKPLEGVIISVSKKLGVNQAEYNSIVTELGGDYSWQYTRSCTHFIFQGRANDLNKEFRRAKSEGKIIVSPNWLYACLEQKHHVDESMYPHTYNPNLNLEGVVTAETPRRGLRSSSRATPRVAQDKPTSVPSTSSQVPRTPARTPAAAASNWPTSGEDEVSVSAKTSARASTSLTVSSTEESAGAAGAGSGCTSGKSGEDEASKITSPVEESEQEVRETGATETGASETGGSLEIREALSKTLETVKASSSRSKKASKKRSRRTDGSSGEAQNNTSGNLSEAATTHHASPWQTDRRGQDEGHASESLGVEASQSIQITWDDPTGRREKERLAHKLEMVCGPSQSIEDTEDFMANMAMPDVSADPGKEDSLSRHPASPVGSPTPEAPPLAFPPARCMSKISSPQPIELLSEESSEGQASKPVMLTSGMEPQERIEYAELVERLGGTMLEKQQFDPACTHVIVCKPSRNEKWLAAVAAGIWVLHRSYLVACQHEGKFVPEENHQWGNPAMSHLMQTLDSQTYDLVQSAYRWRQKLKQMRKTDESCQGAFQGWRVILAIDRKRENNFRRLLSAGGATVLSDRPPFTQVDATHAFVDMQKVKLSESDVEALLNGGAYILKTEYIAAFLTDDPPPAPQSFTPPDVEKLQARLLRKRKAQECDDGDTGKRSRR